MKITIFPEGRYEVESGAVPIVGITYSLEDAVEGTAAQGRAFHALVAEYYRSGLWSYQGSGYKQGATLTEFRNLVKKNLGAGFEAFVYAVLENGSPVIRDAKTYGEIPEEVRADPAYRKLIRGRLKSWTDYTKRERMKTLDNLIAEMIQAGVNSKKFREIMDGMERGENAEEKAKRTGRTFAGT
jgi:hypothetical protein